jgi:hypothetical protein
MVVLGTRVWRYADDLSLVSPGPDREAAVNVVGIISGTSFDAIETAAADLRLEDDAVVLRPLGSRGVAYEPGLRTAVAEALPPPSRARVRFACSIRTWGVRSRRPRPKPLGRFAKGKRIS